MRDVALCVLAALTLSGCAPATPSPSPIDRVSVPLVTGTLPPGAFCAGVQLVDMRLTWDRDTGEVLLEHTGSGEVRRPVWAPGYAAVAIDGELQLTASGQIIAREGDIFETMDVCGRPDGSVLISSFTLRGGG